MSHEAISQAEFLGKYTKELHDKNAAAFIGAGLSIPSGYLDWRALLADTMRGLQLDPEQESDLVTIAQYSVNKAGGNRSGLTKTIFDAFSQIKAPTRNHELLARLPIHTYWTTNYDKLIEKSLENARKIPDVKYTLKHLAVTRLARDVVVYKMHGDVDHSADAVICKDDYESYPLKMEPFIAALRGDLIERTFLFLGLSFSDPNIDYVLSRVRVQYEKDGREHYCVLRQVAKQAGENPAAFKSRQLKQDYFIRDLKRFAINTVLVEEHRETTQLLEQLSASYKRSSIFISGAAIDFGPWGQAQSESFVHALSRAITETRSRIVTGFGLGIGSAVINGALTSLSEAGKAVSEQNIVMRPFPQGVTGKMSLTEHWTAYRRAMIDYAGIAIFLFGNKPDGKGAVIASSGMQEEFELCVAAGVKPIPVGATGFVSEVLWTRVVNDMDRYFPGAQSEFKATFRKLGDKSLTPDRLISVVLEIISVLQKAEWTRDA